MPPAARITDNVAHPLPPVLTGGPTAITVFIGKLPAWRGVGGGVAAGITAANKSATTAIQAAEAATKAAVGPAIPIAFAAEQALKASLLAANTATIMASGTDIHACVTPSPLPPHGPGVVTTPSKTVMIANMPAARLGDTITEAIGPPNKIVKGEATVMIGG